MTLITNEIHLINGLSKSLLVFAADRRISNPATGKYVATRKKLFSIPYLEAGISYFGVAEVFPPGKSQSLSDWLPTFISKQADAPDIQTFAHRLKDALHMIIPPVYLQSMPSGFHMLGYNKQGLPDFWFLSNIGHMDQFEYKDLQARYLDPSPDFLGRDAGLHFDWDGINPDSAKNGICYYRNGDIRSHVVAWEKLDDILKGILSFKDFKSPNTIKGYEEYVRTKFEILAYIYKKFAKRQIIARPIDVFCLSRL